MKRISTFILFVALVVALAATETHAGTPEENEAVYQAYMEFGDMVEGGSVTPGWILGGPSFWIAEGGPQNTVIYRVDPAANAKEELFDVPRLREALTEALGHEPAGLGVPFAQLSFVGPDTVAFMLEGASWTMDLSSYTVAKQPAPMAMDFVPFLVSETSRATPKMFFKESFNGLGPMAAPEGPSPDGKWFASVQDNNIALRATVDGRTVMLTSCGTDEVFWDVETTKWSAWSPDAQRLVVLKHDTTGMARISTIKWLKPLEEAVTDIVTIPAGGVLNRDEIYFLTVQGGLPVKVDLGDTTDQYLRPLTWLPDSSALIFARYDRLLTQVEIMIADPRTGSNRIIMTEKSKTWLTNQHETIWANDTGFWLLPDGSGFIWRSERDGWDHLYRYDMDGNMVQRLTGGEFPVIAVTQIDQAGGYVYFQAHGDSERLYDNHLYRVGLDGNGFEQLTEGEGRHTIAMSPDSSCFVDTFSSVNTPPKTVLRSAGGELLQTLSEADISRLEATGWVPPNEFVVKAADGETDLWVTMFFPYDFDPGRKYPVLEYIYAGPQTTWRPMDFGVASGLFGSIANFARAMAQQGFIVVSMDGRGTPGRSKAFHDTVYMNWGQFEIADHSGAIKQLGERLPYLDLDRVGIWGASWGGHFTFRALTQAPELYKWGISGVPGYDSRAFTLYEVYLGMPADNGAVYDSANALALAPLLQGELLQWGGINDTGTQKDVFRMSEALIRLGKQHEMFVFPNTGHGAMGASGRYNNEMMKRWFIEKAKP
jgi:dipeptidyl aminopeptidase/acylaminoacyl peptidase